MTNQYQLSYEEFFELCQKGKMLSRPGYYSGCGPTSSDLGTEHLERFYNGFKEYFGAEAAANFVRFVNNLKDLSATAFLVAFRKFFADDFNPNISQSKNDRNTCDSRGAALEGEMMGCIFASMFSGRDRDSDIDEQASQNIKYRFICNHKKEIPDEEWKEYNPYNRRNLWGY